MSRPFWEPVVTSAFSRVNATLYACARSLRNLAAHGQARGVSFKLPDAPVTNYGCLAFLILLSLYMMFDMTNPHWYYSLIVGIAGIVILVGTDIGYEISTRHVAKHGLSELGRSHPSEHDKIGTDVR